jgi:replicative superfamily II helicase
MSLIPSAPFPICGNTRQCARCNREKILLRQGFGETSVVVQAPTGSGKTYIFELLYPNLKTQAVFTVPTRAVTTDSPPRRVN